MESLVIEVMLAGGQSRRFNLAEKRAASEVVAALCQGGYVVLKGAGDLGLTSGYVEKAIIGNKACVGQNAHTSSQCVSMSMQYWPPLKMGNLMSLDASTTFIPLIIEI